MCGILCIINPESLNYCFELLNKLSHRGPDDIAYKLYEANNNKIFLGFTRLSINDLSSNGMQPFTNTIKYNNTTAVICNGEIYNHEILATSFGRMAKSDCGVLLNIFNSLPFNSALHYLDAEFALVYFDGNDVYAARDRYGVRPLFVGSKIAMNSDNLPQIIFSSEMKAIPNDYDFVSQLNPSHYAKYSTVENTLTYTEYYYRHIIDTIKPTYGILRKFLVSAVNKRLQSDRPLGFLLSGGLDSSLIVYMATTLMPVDNIECFTIGTQGSPDIKAAKELTTFLGIKKHHVIEFNIEEGIEMIPEVIRCLETYDVTTIRASVPQYILAKYIKNNTNIRVLLSGEGSDEIHGSYKYFEKAPNKEEFKKECARLLSELYYFDNLRTDRTMAAWGLEVRCPFLDHKYVNFVMTSNSEYFMYDNDTKMEKKFLRDSFKGELPPHLLYRSKDAFSDSVSSDKENWRLSIIDKVGNEQEYYKSVFIECYPPKDRLNILPHYWLPKWCGDVTDPSAKILKI